MHKGPPPEGDGPLRSRGSAQTLVTFSAAGPFWPCTMSNSTLSPSASERNPSALIAVWCTKQSFSPDAGVMKPKPFASLNHFTVPWMRAIVLTFHEKSFVGGAVSLTDRPLVPDKGKSRARGQRGKKSPGRVRAVKSLPVQDLDRHQVRAALVHSPLRCRIPATRLSACMNSAAEGK